jgi:hypothetical protein
MSQVSYKTVYDGRNVEVVGGWDAPLNSYHLTVFDLDAPDTAYTDVIYCQLDSFPMGQPRTLGPLKEALQDIGLTVPNSFWVACEKQEGNVLYSVSEDGIVTKR